MRTQICTTKEQSVQLLKTGLDPETADMVRLYMNDIGEVVDWEDVRQNKAGDFYYVEWGVDRPLRESIHFIGKADSLYRYDAPAWSLSTLIEMMPHRIILMKGCNPYELSIYPSNCVAYDRIGEYSRTLESAIAFDDKDLFTQIIEMFEWLIKEGHLDKKYLIEKGGDK